jgi:hypothetical protein
MQLLIHLLRRCGLALLRVQLVPRMLSQFFSFDTPNVPSKRTSRYARRGQLRGDGGEVPFAGHAFERVAAAVFELKS